MSKFKVYRTATFQDKFNALSRKEQEKIENFEKKQLTENPFVGDPLGYNFFREKRLNGGRVYYLIYEDVVIVLLVGISDKKTQQATIDQIKLHLSLYYDYVKNRLLKQVACYCHFIIMWFLSICQKCFAFLSMLRTLWFLTLRNCSSFPLAKATKCMSRAISDMLKMN